ncbi:acyl-[acyl-carrier-protein] thioesterase [Chloroflexota bacterium]
MAYKEDSANVWQDEYRIHSYEVDPKGQATVPFLCQFMQESAWHHAENLDVGFARLHERNLAWVLSRQRVVIDTYPRWGDTIKIHTWATGKGRLFWYRDFKILDNDDNPIGRAATAWFVIDMTSRKPQRADSLQITLPDQIECVFDRRPGKVDTLSSGILTQSTKVGYRDMDVNAHVNNVKYIDWLLDAFDLAFHEAHILPELEINYLSEASYGDEVSVIHQTIDSLTFLHTLIRNKDNTELCRARTLWQSLA